jgi:excisionase family DNA binding protein
MARASRLWPIALSVSEVADALGVHRRIVYQMIAGGVPLYKFGTRRKMLVTDVIAAIPQFFKRDGSPK